MAWKALDYSEYFLEHWPFAVLADPAELQALARIHAEERAPGARGFVMVSALDHPSRWYAWGPEIDLLGPWATPGLVELIQSVDAESEMVVVCFGGPKTRTFVVRVPYAAFRFGVREALPPFER